MANERTINGGWRISWMNGDKQRRITCPSTLRLWAVIKPHQGLQVSLTLLLVALQALHPTYPPVLDYKGPP